MESARQSATEVNRFPPYASNYFPRPAALKDAVHFWRQVFGNWRAHQVVLHDNEYFGIIYDQIEMTGYIGGRLSTEQQTIVDQRKKHLIDQLNDLEYRFHKRIALTAEQQALYNLITRQAGAKALRGAAQRIRIQRGMKESFQTGLEASSRYNAQMRDVFYENRLPEELVHIPHVESAFTTNARSPVGAVGVWQFMPNTGKRYLQIDDAVDERYDPILATQGAAEYLAYAYNKLGDWGLAITSYNYGLSGMLRARQEYGNDIARIVKEYDGASFGFASRNYYAEFLAVCDIMADLSSYFPEGIDYQQPPSVRRIEITQEMTVVEIAKQHHVHYTTLAELNPAWTKEAAEGLIALPANTAVWLPNFVPGGNRLLTAAKRNTTIFAKMHAHHSPLAYLNEDVVSWDILEKFPTGLSGQLLAKAPPISTLTKVAQEQPTIMVQAVKIAKPKLIRNKANEIHIEQTEASVYTIASKYAVHLDGT
jgi:membrane-bound lytic murein transglycosylase D